jgi:hypothetical protein
VRAHLLPRARPPDARLRHGRDGGAAGTPELPESAAQAYLDSVRKARRAQSETVGLGEYRVLAGTVVGGELKDDERLVHLSAFPGEAREDDGLPRGPRLMVDPIAPPTRRRGRR